MSLYLTVTIAASLFSLVAGYHAGHRDGRRTGYRDALAVRSYTKYSS